MLDSMPLDTKRKLILDGGLATVIESKGFDLGGHLWSAKMLLEAPEIIAEVHREYLVAGADIVTSASYQATIDGFRSIGVSQEKAESLLRSSVEIAQSTVRSFWEDRTVEVNNRQRPLVAAGIGPFGAALAGGEEYTGNYSIGKNRLVEFHAERWRILVSTQPDLLLCETIPSFSELQALERIAARNAKSMPDRIPVLVSLSCRDDVHLADGTPIHDCAQLIHDSDALYGIGVNCVPPSYLVKLIPIIRKATNKPLVVYPNSGETYDPATKTWKGAADRDDFGELAKTWVQLGASIVGGCCRTRPEDIRAIRRAFNRD